MEKKGLVEAVQCWEWATCLGIRKMLVNGGGQ